MLKRKAPIWLVAVSVIGIGAFFYAFDSSAAEASVSTKPKVWTSEECLSCHVNERVLKLMQSKRGDPTYCQATYDALVKKGLGTVDKPSYNAK